MKLTKTEKARAKRAVKTLLGSRWRWLTETVSDNSPIVHWTDPEWPEIKRLLRVALRAVERDRG